MKSFRAVALFLLLGSYVVLQSGCMHTLTIGRYQKVVLYAKKGDKIGFDGYQATFQGPTPCKEGIGPIDKCSINVDGPGRFRFTCSANACTDPEIEVGSSNLKAKTKRAPLPKTPTQQPDVIVVLWCNHGNIGIVSDHPADAQHLADTVIPAGKVIEFQADNGIPSQQLVHWSLSAADFCETAGTVINETNRSCRVKSTAGGSYTYTVSSTDPTCNPATGKVTIQ